MTNLTYRTTVTILYEHRISLIHTSPFAPFWIVFWGDALDSSTGTKVWELVWESAELVKFCWLMGSVARWVLLLDVTLGAKA